MSTWQVPANNILSKNHWIHGTKCLKIMFSLNRYQLIAAMLIL